jgi:hypothetical protein
MGLPVKVAVWVTATSEVLSQLLVWRAMGERHVVVSNLIPEVNLLLVEEEPSGDRVDRSIAPSLVEETALPV